MVQGQAVLTGKNPQCQIVHVNVLEVQEVGKIKASLKREEEWGLFGSLHILCSSNISDPMFHVLLHLLSKQLIK